MAGPGRIVIVGAGLAGGTTAKGLRERGYTGEITLIGQQQHRPYELPALSKGVLIGEADEPDWVELAGVEPISGVRVTELDLTGRSVTDSTGATHPYDRLVLATGSAPRVLGVPGADMPGLHNLRTLDDALALRSVINEGTHVVVVGAGWIGCEVAAAARTRGAAVAVVEPQPTPLFSTLGPTIGEFFREIHAAHGIDWHLGVGVAGFTGTDTVTGVELADGTVLAADVVVVGVGAAPRTELAERAGLDLALGGVAVDSTLRTTAPDVYAIGDIAAHLHPRYGERVRVEHWANAKDQGALVAGNLIGAADPYTASPYFFSDQYDLGLEVRGHFDPHADQLVIRGNLRESFIAFWLRDNHVRAAMNVNSWDDGDTLQSLVDNQTAVTPDALRDSDLTALVN
ncbi:NAD(P)/FAD-dependent oxidoreductase [Actinokineospora inagensis]|uniref:NAD(P)/FAD-dependent oxidoreductase n=1 Tax=Actinokineospora inagensis TaxID=103730 RepID=UPI0004017B06|nr:FAD/NAD(P)-binding oxidoreductase [Actinokineospora inagensis]